MVESANPDALKAQGRAHVRAGDWPAAERCYRHTLAANPDDIDSLVTLGFALQQQRRVRDAEEFLRKALTISPTNADAHYILGAIASDEGNYLISITHFTKAVEFEPKLVDAHRRIAIAHVNERNYAAAKEAVQRGLVVNPRSAELNLILGNLLGYERDHAGAMNAYSAGLASQPDSPELYNNLGNTLRTIGRVDAAIENYSKSVELNPEFDDARLNLANALRSKGLFKEALAYFESVLANDPDSVQACVGAAGILEMQDKATDALRLLQGPLTRSPNQPMLRFAEGTIQAKLNRFEEAIVNFQRVAEEMPGFVGAQVELGSAYLKLGDRGRALEALKQAQRLDPDHPACHMVAALSGTNSERASEKYVATLFDWYAEQFDSHLVKALQYNMPDQIAAKLRSVGHAKRGNWRVLDLGCGTGLAGVAIGADATTLIGVDLSERMLDKAYALNLYTRLIRADLDSMMAQESADSYDVVVAADVFVYIGKLDSLVARVHRLLRPGGLFAFSVEALTSDDPAKRGAEVLPDYLLKETGRYVHTRTYLQRLAMETGFEVLGITDAHGRVNEGKPVPGYIGLFRRSDEQLGQAS